MASQPPVGQGPLIIWPSLSHSDTPQSVGLLWTSDRPQWGTQEFCSGGVQQNKLGTEDRENGDLGAVAPYSGVLEAAVIWYKKFHFI